MDVQASQGGSDRDLVTLAIGQAVGRYRILSVLGHGGFGITYRALDGELQRQVALKEYLPAALAVRQDGSTVVPRSTSAAQDYAWGRDRFVAEGRTLAALHRLPGVVQVHDFLEANGTAYLVMELLDGETLQNRITAKGPLDAPAFERLLQPLLDGLEQVHAVGFLHRDIKPANILLDRQGNPTLIDFGAARVAVAGRSQAMTAVFTPGYAAAEQFTAATQGPYTDIYGLAATLHFAIAGTAPPNAVDRLLDDAYVPLSQSRRPIEPRALAAIDAGLAVRAADRPQSVAAWRSLFSNGTAAIPAAPATVVMRGATIPKPKAARRPIMMAVGALGVILLAGGTWFLAAPHSAPSPPTAAATPTAAAVADHTQEELDAARKAQQAALEETNRLRAEAEARRKADEEAALRRKIEDEMRQKAVAEQAARQRAAEEAKTRADAERAKTEADRAGAEAAETALHLEPVDRKRLQVALAALGFGTAGTDGVFGPHTREMLAAWQKSKGLPATGYVSAETQRALLQDAAAAVARFDDEQRKAAPATPQSQTAAAAGASRCEGSFSSQWCRGAFQGFPPSCWNVPMSIRNGAISGQWTSPGATEAQSFTGRVASDGSVNIVYNGIGAQTFVGRHFQATLVGSVTDGVLVASGHAGENGRNFSVRVQCR
jgi:peptidoglycan hydrolase-like protein with peptidoglycan-binding domain